MSKKNGDERPKGLNDLKNMEIDLPKIKPIDVAKIRKEVEDDKASALKVVNWMAQALEQVEAYDKEEDADVKARMRENVDVYVTEINRRMDSKNEIERRMVRSTLLVHGLQTQEFRGKNAIFTYMERFVKNGVLKIAEDEKGKFRVNGNGTSFSPDDSSFFTKEEENEVSAALHQAVRDAEEREGTRLREAAGNILERADLNTVLLDDMLAGKKGALVLSNPKEWVSSDEREEGGGFFRAAVTIALKSDGSNIALSKDVSEENAVVTKNDNLRNGLLHLIQKGLVLPVATLNTSVAPTFSGIGYFSAGKLMLLWHIIRKAMEISEEKKRRAQIKKGMNSKATISQDDFMEKNNGTALVEYSGQWEVKDNDGPHSTFFPDVFFLVTREEEKINIVEIPTHLSDLLGHLVGKPHFESQLPQPLEAILKACRTQKEKREKIRTPKSAE